MREPRARRSTHSGVRPAAGARPARRPGVVLAAVVAVAAVTAAGCGSTKKAATSAATSAPTATPASSTAPTPTSTPATSSPASATSTTAPAPGGLSGTWSGQYSGAFQGTFLLTWQQSASNLNGTIKLSAPARTFPISGTVEGDAIRFGTVGAGGINYTGSVSGASMSGAYTIRGGAGSTGGSWSATKGS